MLHCEHPNDPRMNQSLEMMFASVSPFLLVFLNYRERMAASPRHFPLVNQDY